MKHTKEMQATINNLHFYINKLQELMVKEIEITNDKEGIKDLTELMKLIGDFSEHCSYINKRLVDIER